MPKDVNKIIFLSHQGETDIIHYSQKSLHFLPLAIAWYPLRQDDAFEGSRKMDKCTSIKNVQFLNFYLNDRACVTVSIFHLLCEPFKVNRFLTATSRRKYDEKLIKRKEKKYQGSELKGDFFFSCHHYLDVSWLAVNMKKFFFSLFLTTESNTISELTKKKKQL